MNIGRTFDSLILAGALLSSTVLTGAGFALGLAFTCTLAFFFGDFFVATCYPPQLEFQISAHEIGIGMQ